MEFGTNFLPRKFITVIVILILISAFDLAPVTGVSGSFLTPVPAAMQ